MKKRDSSSGVFLWILWNFQEQLFYIFIEHLRMTASTTLNSKNVISTLLIVTIAKPELTIIVMTVCSCHVRYAFQSESTFYSCLNVKELLARSRHEIWRFSDCNWTRTHNHLVHKRTLNHLAKLASLFKLWQLYKRFRNDQILLLLQLWRLISNSFIR